MFFIWDLGLRKLFGSVRMSIICFVSVWDVPPCPPFILMQSGCRLEFTVL